MSLSKTRDSSLSNAHTDGLISPALRNQMHSSDVADGDGDEKMDAQEQTPIGTQKQDANFEFVYGFLRDIVYEQMLFNQRKQLHTNAQNYIAKCLRVRNNDKLSLLHTRHVENVLRYSDLLQGGGSTSSASEIKANRTRPSFFARKKG